MKENQECTSGDYLCTSMMDSIETAAYHDNIDVCLSSVNIAHFNRQNNIFLLQFHSKIIQFMPFINKKSFATLRFMTAITFTFYIYIAPPLSQSKYLER